MWFVQAGLRLGPKVRFSMAAKERLAEVVAQHAPVLYMHPRDLFMPCTVEWFSAHFTLSPPWATASLRQAAGPSHVRALTQHNSRRQ